LAEVARSGVKHVNLRVCHADDNVLVVDNKGGDDAVSDGSVGGEEAASFDPVGL
jgi:hypothetical protein